MVFQSAARGRYTASASSTAGDDDDIPTLAGCATVEANGAWRPTAAAAAAAGAADRERR